ncbi:Subtilase family protein [Microlunatus soli]|uniref:Subtilase family protein n=2 Tax=Microlunatus soli TaxID=630515 RepID=A0A1H1NK56_9ACTN|nr:Subtilase family protein [Microlunatus soli]
MLATAGFGGPLDFGSVVEQLQHDPRVEVRQSLRPRSVSAQTLGTTITDHVVVADMPDDVAAELRGHPQVVIEEDHLLQPQELIGGTIDPGVLIPFGVSTSWSLKIVDEADRPVVGATVYLYGSGVPAQGRTDDTGMISISLLNESDAGLRALYVNPQSGYWSMWVDRPQLTSGSLNTVRLQSLGAELPGFPDQQLIGWGQRAMRLESVPAGMTGRGIKVAVVDSGAAVRTHADLGAIHSGMDLTTTPANDQQWIDDTIAHGSHCSGIIAGADNGRGIRGFAPDAELVELRIFPGGRVSSLIDAVDYCIDQQIDVVNMSLGTGGSSQILLQKIAQAKELGVACIVAAGNTGGEVQFPGVSPDVLTVSAIGSQGTFPDNSYHAQQRWSGGTLDHDLFAAQFSCHGPEVDVAGPGVAIVSSVPPDGFAAWDGTSMATPHITGLAALTLAHHPDFAGGALSNRNAARVDHLFDLLRAAATPLSFGDPQRSGAGLPDCLRALGLQPGAQGSFPDAAAADADAIRIALAQLRLQLLAAGLLTEPAGAALVDDGLSERTRIRRGMAELRAQMLAASLSV